MTEFFSIERRSLILGLLATGVTPMSVMSAPTDPDVVVIGAGAAGIAAAHRLIAEGKSVVVVEAAARVGGRAYTESTTFGLPYDHGCAWLQGPRDLPLVAKARQSGFDLLDHNTATDAVFVGDRRANSTERRQYDRAFAALEQALEAASGDRPASEVVPGNLPLLRRSPVVDGPHGLRR